MLVYLAGPYTGNQQYSALENISRARDIAIEGWEKGYTVLCPHLNTAHFEHTCKATYDQYLAGDFEMLKRCDAVVMLPRWDDSNGARKEYEYAKRLGIPVCIYPDWPPKDMALVKRYTQSEVYHAMTVAKVAREAMAYWTKAHVEAPTGKWAVNIDCTEPKRPVRLVQSGETIETNQFGGKGSDTGYRFDLLDPKAMFALAETLKQGADKYAPNNWRKCPVNEHLNHAQYHINKWFAGDESEDHLGHAFCRLMMAKAQEGVVLKTEEKAA